MLAAGCVKAQAGVFTACVHTPAGMGTCVLSVVSFLFDLLFLPTRESL